MSLPGSGPLSASMISNEMKIGKDGFSAYEAGVLTYSGLNAAAISSSGKSLKIDPDIPMSMSMWYGYNHQLTFSGSEVVSFGLLAPYPMLNKTLSMQETFVQLDMGLYNVTASFTASNLVKSGLAPGTEISYSVYYASYSILLEQYYPEKLIKTGIISSTSLSDSFNYVYNATSGSIVTIRFQNLYNTVPSPYINYNQYTSPLSAGVWANTGTGGSAYNLKSTGSITSGGSGAATYLSISSSNTINYLSGSTFDLNSTSFTVSYFGRTVKFSGSNTNWEYDGNLFSFKESGSYSGLTTYNYRGSATGGSGSVQQLFKKQDGSGYGTGYEKSGRDNKFAPNEWYHLVCNVDYLTHTASFYCNGYLGPTVNMTYNAPTNQYYFFNTGSMISPKLFIGADGLSINDGTTALIDIHAMSVWTGSILSQRQIDLLYKDYATTFGLL